MRLSRSNIIRLENFLDRIQSNIYPEPEDGGQEEIARRMLNYLIQNGYLKPGSRILDVGCGRGFSMAFFAEQGFSAVGITLGQEDLKICRQKGLDVFRMDQSFLDFKDDDFDLIWCRHCLEHSIFPYFTLSEFLRVLKPGGHLYVEVPAPDTTCRHQSNQNHYSVLGKSMWMELITRSEFIQGKVFDIDFETVAGPDTYFGFIQQKPCRPDTVPAAGPAGGASIRKRYRLERSQISQIDLTRFSKYVANQQHRKYFFDVDFKEHYRLIAYLSTLFEDANIFDIGTNLGYSALALSFNPKNTVVSYDIVECKQLHCMAELTNIQYRIGDVIRDGRLAGAPLIMLDTDHDGVFENRLYTYLKENNYQGLLFLDDIHLNQAMRDFWNSISEAKADLTDLGHWSGSGIVDFQGNLVI